MAFAQHTEEGFVVLVFVEDSLPGISTVQGMVDRTSLIRPFLSGYDSSRWKVRFRSLLQEYSPLVTSEKTPVPFSAL